MFKSWYSFVVYCIRAAVRFGVALLMQVAAAWVVAAVLLTVGRMFGRLVQACGFDISCLVERYRNVGASNCCLALMLSRKKGRKDYFAFGPYLCLGAAYAWYLQSARW